jgi:hypothetical protein
VHSRQSDKRDFPTDGLKVPEGHKIGEGVPSGQYIPAGHLFPVIPSVGDDNEAFSMQKYPAVQFPVGDDRFAALQYFPPGQGI